MKISVRGGYVATDVTIEAENVKIVEDISEMRYGKKEDGKTDYSKRLGSDITNEYMDQFTTVLDDIIYYREQPYDSSELIKKLVNKLPSDIRENLLKELNNEYLDAFI